MAEIDIGVDASGTTVHARIDDHIVVRLPENASTGFQWTVESLSEQLQLVSSDLLFGGSREPGAPGASAEREMRIACTAPGTGQARLELRRAWETEPLERFGILVRID